MAQFRYFAQDADGRSVSGELDADSTAEALAQLQSQGYRTTHLAPVGPAEVWTAAPGGEPERLPDDALAEVGGRVIGIAGAGLPLAGGLRALASELPSRRLRRTLNRISARLEAGEPLDAVLGGGAGRAPGCVPLLIQSGVRSGQVGVLLERYLNFARGAIDRRRRVGMGLLYPLLLILAALGIVGFYLIWVLPQVGTIFTAFDTETPWATAALLAASRFAEAYWPWMMLVLFGGPLLIPVAATLVGGRVLRRRLLHAVPVFGAIWRESALSRFCHLLALLLENGVALPTAVRMAARGSEDPVMQRVGDELAARVEQGGRLDEPLPSVRAMSPLLPPFLRWERRGDAFPDVLHGAGEVFGTRATVRAGLIAAVLEPLIVLGAAIAVGTMMVLTFLPLIKLLNVLS